MKVVKIILPIIIVLVLSFWAIRPLLSPGLFPVHDDTQVQRVFEMTKSLNAGMFPVRWSMDLGFGFGYPIFNFYAPLAYYSGSFFNLLGFNVLISAKLMMGLGILLSGIFMYLLGKELFGKAAGVVAALFYVYAPYHAVDIYVRGDVAEFWAYAFIPLAFYGVIKTYKENNFKNAAIGALGFAGIILSHNLTAMMVSPFLLLLILVLFLASFKKEKKVSFNPFWVLIFGALISCFYWLPALSEMKYTNVLSQIGQGGFSYWDNFVCPGQLWTSPWGFGGSVPGCNDGLSFMIGKLHIILSFASAVSAFILLLIKKFRKDSENFYIILLLFLGFVFSAVLTLQISKPLWDSIRLMAFFQFPWRFLVMASFFSSLLAGSSVWFFRFFPFKKYASYLDFGVATVLLAFLIFVSSKYFITSPILPTASGEYSGIYSENSGKYTTKYAISWFASNLTHEYMPSDFLVPENPSQISNGKVIVKKGNVNIKNITRTPVKYAFTAESKNLSSIVIPVAYFPFWSAYIDGNIYKLSVLDNGVGIKVSPGIHQIQLKYSQTPVELLSDLISVAGIAALIAGIILSARKRYE